MISPCIYSNYDRPDMPSSNKRYLILDHKSLNPDLVNDRGKDLIWGQCLGMAVTDCNVVKVGE